MWVLSDQIEEMRDKVFSFASVAVISTLRGPLFEEECCKELMFTCRCESLTRAAALDLFHLLKDMEKTEFLRLGFIPFTKKS